jgi:hypothetical protein
LFKGLREAKTSNQIRNVLELIPPLSEVSHIAMPTSAPDSQLIMHKSGVEDGVEDGVITQSEYLVAKLASDHRIPKRVINAFIETVALDDFNPDDIRFDKVQTIED